MKKLFIFILISLGVLVSLSFIIDMFPDSQNNRIKKAPTAESKINEAISESLNDRLKKITIKKDQNGNFNVYIMFTGSSSFTDKLMVNGIKSQMENIYFNIYKNIQNINDVTINAYLPMVDKYGNVSEDSVLTTSLPGKKAYKINWNQDIGLIKYQIIPNLWTVEWMYPALGDINDE